MAIFGDYFCDLPPSLITDKEPPANSVNPEIYRGRGKRLAFFTEPNEGVKVNSALLKRWTGGERISCRTLYENPIQYTIFFKIIILCNTKFELQDIQDEAMPRRIVYTKFKTKFDANPKFEFQKLRVDEYKTKEFINKIKGSFMNMLINNYKKLHENNFQFDMPKDMIDDNNEFIDNNDEVKTYINSECIKTNSTEDYITSKDLFTSFLFYTRQNNIKTTIKEKDFKTRVSKEIPFKERHRPYVDGKQLNLRSVFTNIAMNEE
jgi:phage/plasmid-associated DNA primase